MRHGLRVMKRKFRPWLGDSEGCVNCGGVKPTESGAPVALDQGGERGAIRPESTELPCLANEDLEELG